MYSALTLHFIKTKRFSYYLKTFRNYYEFLLLDTNPCEMNMNNDQLKEDMDKFLLDLGINNIFNKELFGSLKETILAAINNQTADEDFRNTAKYGLNQAKIQINGHMTSKNDFWIEDIENGYLAGKLFEIDTILEQL